MPFFNFFSACLTHRTALFILCKSHPETALTCAIPRFAAAFPERIPGERQLRVGQRADSGFGCGSRFNGGKTDGACRRRLAGYAALGMQTSRPGNQSGWIGRYGRYKRIGHKDPSTAFSPRSAFCVINRNGNPLSDVNPRQRYEQDLRQLSAQCAA